MQTQRIPDFINKAKSRKFTQIPNELLRNPNISGKAKALLALLLSNKEGWHSSERKLVSMMKESRGSVSSGLKELEEYGYLKRMRYRDIHNKQYAGMLWVYTDTPWEMELDELAEQLKDAGMELINSGTNTPDTENAGPEKAKLEKAKLENQSTKNTNIKNTNNKNKNQYIGGESDNNNKNTNGDSDPNGIIKFDQFPRFWELYPRKVNKVASQKAWNTLCSEKPTQRPKWRTIRKALAQQKRSEQWEEVLHIPHASTWLNQRRWLDEISGLNGKRKDTNKGTPAKPNENKLEEEYSW